MVKHHDNPSFIQHHQPLSNHLSTFIAGSAFGVFNVIVKQLDWQPARKKRLGIQTLSIVVFCFIISQASDHGLYSWFIPAPFKRSSRLELIIMTTFYLILYYLFLN